MKKLFCIVLVVAFMFCLCACSILDLGEFVMKSGQLPNSEISDIEIPTMEVPTTELPTTAPSATEASNITLNTYAITLCAGETFQLTADATNQNTLRWKSSNESIVLVNSQGLVTAASAGVANITCYDGETEATCTVNVINLNSNANDTPAYVGTFIFPHSSSAYLTSYEISQKLAGMYGQPIASSFAQDAINEIYARNGYIFQSDNLSAYYYAQPWYTPDASFSIADLNPYEKENVRLLQSFT